jgi:hypothetical protein
MSERKEREERLTALVASLTLELLDRVRTVREAA